MTLYLDTSFLVPLFCGEPKSQTAFAWAEEVTQELILSDLVQAEFNSALSRKVREGLYDLAGVQRLRVSFEIWSDQRCRLVNITSGDISVSGMLVQIPKPRLLVPDAIHLAICRRLGLTLVTFDQDLFTVAAREGVEAILPS